MKKIIIAIIALVIFCVSARAEIIKCSKMKGQLLNIQKQYVPVDFSGDSVVVQHTKDTATLITDDEKMECFIIADNNNFFSCANTQDGAVNLLTYYKKSKKLFYSKHSHLLETQSQYYAICEELEK